MPPGAAHDGGADQTCVSQGGSSSFGSKEHPLVVFSLRTDCPASATGFALWRMGNIATTNDYMQTATFSYI